MSQQKKGNTMGNNTELRQNFFGKWVIGAYLFARKK
jgi:hypothetical protein